MENSYMIFIPVCIFSQIRELSKNKTLTKISDCRDHDGILKISLCNLAIITPSVPYNNFYLFLRLWPAVFLEVDVPVELHTVSGGLHGGHGIPHLAIFKQCVLRRDDRLPCRICRGHARSATVLSQLYKQVHTGNEVLHVFSVIDIIYVVHNSFSWHSKLVCISLYQSGQDRISPGLTSCWHEIGATLNRSSKWYIVYICRAVYANYIGPSVMTDANKVGPVKDPLYVMIKLLKMTDLS